MAPHPPRAVVIEDDPDIRHLIKTVLESSGFEPYTASNGADGIELVRQYDPAVTTLDITLPGIDGFATAKYIREFSSTYLIMLTGLGDEIDVVQGLQVGADDYLVKPFRPRELRARIESGLRRLGERDDAGAEPQQVLSGSPAVTTTPPQQQAVAAVQQQAVAAPQQVLAAQSPVPAALPQATPAGAATAAGTQGGGVAITQPDGSVSCRGLVLDPATRLVTVDDRPVELTRTEFDLLQALLVSGRRVRSKADLVLALRGQDYVTSYFVNEADKRAVEVHMANLRRKIGDSTASPRWIETVRGVGYRLAAD